MWYQVTGERVSDNGAAAGSRAVLTLAVLFFFVCLAQSVMTVMAEHEGAETLPFWSSPLNR